MPESPSSVSVKEPRQSSYIPPPMDWYGWFCGMNSNQSSTIAEVMNTKQRSFLPVMPVSSKVCCAGSVQEPLFFSVTVVSSGPSLPPSRISNRAESLMVQADRVIFLGPLPKLRSLKIIQSPGKMPPMPPASCANSLLPVL